MTNPYQSPLEPPERPPRRIDPEDVTTAALLIALIASIMNLAFRIYDALSR